MTEKLDMPEMLRRALDEIQCLEAEADWLAEFIASTGEWAKRYNKCSEYNRKPYCLGRIATNNKALAIASWRDAAREAVKEKK